MRYSVPFACQAFGQDDGAASGGVCARHCDSIRRLSVGVRGDGILLCLVPLFYLPFSARKCHCRCRNCPEEMLNRNVRTETGNGFCQRAVI